jgi:hypothetical protein
MAFTPANVPIDLWVGNHKTIVRGFKTTDTNGDQIPIDLSAADVYFTVFNGDTKLIELSTVASTVTIQGTGNEQVSVTLTPTQTRTIASATYDEGSFPKYEIEIRQSGVESTWVYGKIRLLGGQNVDAATTTPAP